VTEADSIDLQLAGSGGAALVIAPAGRK
jgi:hypothetical protein